MTNYMTTIGEVAEIYDGPHATPEKIENGPYYLSISSLESGRLDLSKSAFLSESDFQTWTKRVAPQKGDILFSYETRLGEAALMPEGLRACLGRRMGLLRPKINKVTSEYLLYAYIAPQFQQTIVSNTIKGATVERIALNKLSSFNIRIPDFDEQKNVAGLLTSIDSKIEINNRINIELEAMAKTLYDYWFVQFDFPDLDGKPYKTSGGKMVWNEELKRAIPDGWEVGKLKDIANIIMGQSPPGESYNNEAQGMIFFQGCTDFGNRFPTVRQFTTQPTRYAKEGDILLSVRAPVGTLNIAKENCCIGRGLAALNSKDNCIAYLFGVMLNLKQIFDRRNVDGTTFGSITKDDLFSLTVVKPDKEILKKYHEIINPAFEKQNKLELENQTLSELRDWLLPMLMNGQVQVTPSH